MIEIGKYNSLEVLKALDFGIYLDGGPYGEILLPIKYVPEGVEPGDDLEVFLYSDSEDRLITTTDKPKAIVGEIAMMETKEVSEYGAFLDWGIEGKDLMVPFREQRERMEPGRHYLVYVYLDEVTDRIVGSNKLNKFLEAKTTDLAYKQEVDIIVAAHTDLGYRVIVNNAYWAALYKNEVFEKLQVGDRRKAFVKKIREDQRIDISLQQPGAGEIDRSAAQVLEAIQANNGFLPLTDKSSPELIYDRLKMSKKNFKRAVGNLYKQRIILLEKGGLRLKEA